MTVANDEMFSQVVEGYNAFEATKDSILLTGLADQTTYSVKVEEVTSADRSGVVTQITYATTLESIITSIVDQLPVTEICPNLSLFPQRVMGY
ncbi:hypothetical protein [Tunicatimonas pelagia]|uniref:hypothetical protein n=1 Tax=Tunicatimonas pelagia TaxID=931531 RepID=UPI002665EEB1|nr:hypothetical protein [Tunicatimonas pelagia]WKN41343.1 hypothetical protein P0M28_20105 [Tunicatimonas pelagia]